MSNHGRVWLGASRPFPFLSESRMLGPTMNGRVRIFVTALAASATFSGFVAAEQFNFSNGQNGITGITSAVIPGIDFQMQLSAAPDGALLDEIDAQGMGINSVPVSGQDDDASKFNLIEGSGPFVGQGERLQFSFDRAGLITGLNFDGVKDETFEYFLLESSGLTPTFFFDSQADPAQINVDGDVVFLLEDDFFDDEIVGLAIPFTANQELAITYGQLLAGNGSRFEGITVEVPEPSTIVLLLVPCIGLWRRRASTDDRSRCAILARQTYGSDPT